MDVQSFITPSVSVLIQEGFVKKGNMEECLKCAEELSDVTEYKEARSKVHESFTTEVIQGLHKSIEESKSSIYHLLVENWRLQDELSSLKNLSTPNREKLSFTDVVKQ